MGVVGWKLKPASPEPAIEHIPNRLEYDLPALLAGGRQSFNGRLPPAADER
jgi:hypothetical protein